MADPATDSMPLDEAVFPAAKALAGELHAPDALFLLGTGFGALATGFTRARRVSLRSIPGVPPAWRGMEILAGERDGLNAWAMVDAPGPVEFGEAHASDEPPWTRAFPCWLARAAGAEILLHSSAGTTLSAHGASAAPPVGAIALVRDHLNLSGSTPLLGLGPTRLGPLFPDVSRLHDGTLRAKALDLARERGLGAAQAVAACTLGPALDTPAELAFFARAGASIAVQGLAAPLIAAAHAGLAVLALCAITDAGGAPADLASILARADEIAPPLEELVLALCGALAARAAGLRESR